MENVILAGFVLKQNRFKVAKATELECAKFGSQHIGWPEIPSGDPGTTFWTLQIPASAGINPHIHTALKNIFFKKVEDRESEKTDIIIEEIDTIKEKPLLCRNSVPGQQERCPEDKIPTIKSGIF